MQASLKAVGAARSIVVDRDNRILAGNGIVEAATKAGFRKVRIVDTEADTLIAVRRRDLTPSQARDLAYYDNRAGELAEWDVSQIAADRLAGVQLRAFWTAEEEANLLSAAAADDVLRMAAAAAEDDDGDAPVGTGDYQTFSCPLTVEQERTVRAALRSARRFYSVTTAGDALAAALHTWMQEHGEHGPHQ
jgi:hypothetical protein